MTRFERLRWLGIATLSGLLFVFATAPFDLWFLAWIAPVPLLFAIARATTTRRALLYGWWAGFVASAGGFYWITNMLVRFGGLPWIVGVLGIALLAAYQGLVLLLVAAAVRGVRRAFPALPLAVIAPLAIVTFEFLVPMIFPYTLAITQAWHPVLIQIADVTGGYGVTAVLFCVGGAVVDIAGTREPRRRLISACVAASVVAVTLGYGAIRIRQIDARRAAAPKLAVGLVQPNVAMRERDFQPRSDARQLADLQRLTGELEARGAEIVIWPEAAYPYLISRGATRDWRASDLEAGSAADPDLPPVPIRSRVSGDRHSHVLTPAFRGPVVIGAITDSEADLHPHNSAIFVEPDGSFSARFDKTRLVLFSETIPMSDRFAWIRNLLPRAAGQFAHGDGAKVFPFRTAAGAEVRLAPMICYEDIIPSFGREVGALRPHLLVNITNDAWFGAFSEPWEHLALSVFRTVELRTDLVRAVNTGVTAHVDAAGRLVQHGYSLDQKQEPSRDPNGTTFLANVALLEGGSTIYAAVGDLFSWLCAASVFGLWLLVPRLRARREAVASSAARNLRGRRR